MNRVYQSHDQRARLILINHDWDEKTSPLMEVNNNPSPNKTGKLLLK